VLRARQCSHQDYELRSLLTPVLDRRRKAVFNQALTSKRSLFPEQQYPLNINLPDLLEHLSFHRILRTESHVVSIPLRTLLLRA
jgi:hypothetical protein